ncbi:MAG: sensor histidine kinase [Lachnospiraceae bacterium]|nr:sensor histidine kinase [Lachnospiraceae bacterium]
MRRLKDLSIKAKIVIYTYLFVTPILLCISVIMYCSNLERFKEEMNKECASDVESLYGFVGSIESVMQEFGSYITINSEIREILEARNIYTLNQESDLWTDKAPFSFIHGMIALNGQIKTIALFPENQVMPYTSCLDHSSFLQYEDIRDSKPYKQAINSRGNYSLYRAGKGYGDFYESNMDDKIVLCREIFNVNKSVALGYICIGADSQAIDDACAAAAKYEENYVFVLNFYGDVVASNKDVPNNILRDYQSGQLNDYIPFTNVGDNEIYSVVKLADKAKYDKLYLQALDSALYFMIGVLIGLLPVLLIVSNLITKPLLTLRKAMDDVKRGNLNQHVRVQSADEIGQVSATFNSMMQEMNSLILRNYVLALREKQSEIDVLQAQINPHFLYNTLDSLYWNLVDAGNEKLAEDVLALSDLFRLTLNNGESMVELRKESELLERYLSIQKMRFGKRLEYRFEIEESLYSVKIPKLILQPFVENAVVHGFEKVQQDFCLIVRARSENGYCHLEVEDNGVGMTKEQLDSIWVEDSRKYSGQRIGRYAIKNIRDRLEILYDDRYSLEIQSDVNIGTKVIIRIPI